MLSTPSGAAGLPGSDPGLGGVSVHLVDVTAGYGRLIRRRRSLEALDLDAQPGSITALVGPNGAGKTTLMRLLLGFLDPWSGTVEVAGMKPSAYRRAEGVGYLPEIPVLPTGWTVRSILEEGAWLSGLRGVAHSRAVDGALARVGLEADGSRPVSALSKGTARRATLAFALLGEPRMVLLDEPWAGLDPAARTMLRRTVREIRDRGVTVVLASHELAEVAGLADRVAVLWEGRLLALLDGDEVTVGRIEDVLELRERPADGI